MPKLISTEYVPRDFYDGHKHQHNAGILNFVGYDGCCHGFSGPNWGSMNDIQMWYSSDQFQHRNRWFGNGTILGDGIFKYCRGNIVAQFLNPVSARERLFNVLHTLSRVPVEHYHGRLKGWWGILDKRFTLDYDDLGLIYLTCVILTNFLIKEQAPLRANV